MASLQVKNVFRPKENPPPPHNPVLPAPSFMLVMVAPVKSGKTTLIMNMCYNKAFYKNWERVVIISPTVLNDGSWAPALTQKNTTTHTEYSDDIIKALVESQEQIPKPEMPHVLLVIDDCVGLVRRHSAVNHLASRYRHYNISMVFSTQLFRELPPVVRANASAVFIFQTHNKRELTKMEDEYASLTGGEDSFRHLYNEATKEKYSFLYIDVTRGLTRSSLGSIVFER